MKIEQSMKKNGYLVPPIMDTEQGKCFICGYQGQTVVHEVFYGTANRKQSKEWGTWVNICPRCHRFLHANPSDEVSRELERTAYKLFCSIYGRDKFREVFGRYYD